MQLISWAVVMIYVNTTSFVEISKLEKDHSIIETRRLKNVVNFSQTILSLLLSRKVWVCFFVEKKLQWLNFLHIEMTNST